MARENVKHWFDLAYQHMFVGDFASATNCFEQVIKYSGDSHASLIAEQKIRWYCTPVESIIKSINESENPVDVHKILSDLFLSDSHYIESEHPSIIEIVEKQLTELPSVIRLSNTVWIRKDTYNLHFENLTRAILQSSRPLMISTWLRNQFRDCEPPDNYPDDITLGVFESALKQFPIVIFAKEYCITKIALSAQIDSLANHIRVIGKPVLLLSLVEILFSQGSPELTSQIALSLSGQLDTRFVEVTHGYIFLIELLKLNSDTFEDLFLLSPTPLSTDTLASSSLFSDQTTQALTQQFQSIAEQQLAQNQNIQRVGQSNWITKKLANKFYTQAETYLLKAGTFQNSQTILEKIWQTDSISKVHRNLLIELLADCFRNSKEIIRIEPQNWIHISILEQAVDNSYQQLLHSTTPLSTNELIKSNLNPVKTNISQGLILTFEKSLLIDDRFIPESGVSPRRWQAVDPQKRDNQAAQKILKRRHKILTFEEIKSLLIIELDISSPAIELENDARFKVFSPDHWGLFEWIIINDQAYDYLIMSRQALHEIVIRGLICKQIGIKEENAIFTPSEDPRFAQDSINRWFCRHWVSAAEMDLLHEELIRYGGTGRKIEYLTKQVLRKDADATDAESCLQADERFICLDELWFARQAAFYALNAEDVEKIFSTLASQADSRGAISLKELILLAIGHDGRLTDAATWLLNDKRFIEVHDGFWTLTSIQAPDFSRSGTGGVAVQSPTGTAPLPGTNEEIEEGKLTIRKPRSKKGENTNEPIKKVYITLTHLDIRHGNLRIFGMLKEWVPDEAKNIHFKDEEDYEFIAYIDESGSILNIREWMERRRLTYGDKISIQPVSKGDELLICPYGKRDEKVYQEAIDHEKEIEKLIAEARRVNKNFHDLMIEVMEEFDYPLHREDIYQLVNYQRMASRNTISEILSLPDCPFEELRYFIPVGAGKWKFDRNRKEVYDMKMQELLTEKSALQRQLVDLQAQLESQKGSEESTSLVSAQIELFQQIIAETNDKVEKLQKDKTAVEQGNFALQSELEILRVQMAKYQADLAESQVTGQQTQNQTAQEKAQLQEKIKILDSQVERLNSQAKVMQEWADFEIKELRGKLGNQINEYEKLLAKNNNLVTELAIANADKESLHSEIDQLKSINAAIAEKSDANLALEQANIERLREEIEHLIDEKEEITCKLEADVKLAQENEKNLQREIEQLKQESTRRIGQLEEELAVTQIRIAQSQEITNSPAPSKFKLFLQGITKMLFRKKF